MSIRLSQALEAASEHFRSTSTVLADNLRELSNLLELLAIAICRQCPCWTYAASFGESKIIPGRMVEKLRFPTHGEASEALKTDIQLAIELERKLFISETDVQTVVEMARCPVCRPPA